MFLMTNSFCINKKSFLPIAIFLLIIFFSAIYKINSKNLTYKTQASSPKIYGGQPADPGEWPFTVALYDKRIYNKNFLDRNSNTYKIGTLKDAQFCTGLLINNRYVLTAAHCLYEQIADPTEFAIYKKRVVKDFGVAVGFHDINTREIITSRDLKQALVEAKNYLIYEGYNYGFKYRDSIPFVEFNKMTDTQQNNDLAYIKIDPLDKSLSFETISLTKDQRLITPGSYAQLVGWGSETGLPDVLYEGINKIYSNTYQEDNRITHRLILFETAMPLSGDSGGPLLGYSNGKWYVVGLAAQVDQSISQSYYTNLVELYPWVNLVTNVKENQGSFIGKPPEW